MTGRETQGPELETLTSHGREIRNLQRQDMEKPDRHRDVTGEKKGYKTWRKKIFKKKPFAI